jgi:endonuclease/exonuclease/phosphatase family metal-dependent hydrolase
MKLKVITFNIRYANQHDGDHRWELRRPRVLEWLREQNADLVALQEVLPVQRDELDAALPHYRSYGVSRDAERQSEQCAWLVRDPWWMEEADTFWLSPTPRQASVGWDAALPRVCSVLRLSGPEGNVWAANVHLDHEGVVARQRGLEMVIGAYPGDVPGVIVGDLNQQDLAQSVAALAQWKDAQLQAGQGDWGTFHGFEGGTLGDRIDAILYSPHWRLQRFHLGQDPALSDHYPLVAELEATPA